jgi:lambda family phage portal protein
MKTTLLDRAISYLAPTWGLSRIRARAAEQVMLAYEGARIDRRMGSWITQDTSANAEITGVLPRLRQRSRDLVRNNAYATKAVRELVGHAVGTGIRAQTHVPDNDRATVARVDDAWKAFVDECDSDGQLDFYGIQRMAVRSVVEAGEALIRMRPRYASDGLTVPLQLQFLEPDYLDHNKTETTPAGGRIIQGVEFDPLGRRIAYWLYPDHPGEVLVNYMRSSLRSERVPAQYVLHLYEKDRSQVRGVPWFAPVMINMRDLDEYAEAELVRKKIEACFAAFVTQPEGADGPTIGPLRKEDHQDVETVEPGMVRYLAPGEEVTFGTPAGSGAGYRSFMRDHQTRIASGIGITYEQLTGDLSNVNYSSYRAGLLSFQNFMDQFRWLTFMPMFCRPIRNWFLQTAFSAGLIPATAYATEWHPPSYGSVDPKKDQDAKTARVRTGMQTWRQAVSEEGYDPDEQLQEIADTNAAFDRAQVILDSDPRNRTGNGNAVNNSSSQTQAPEPDASKEKE